MEKSKTYFSQAQTARFARFGYYAELNGQATSRPQDELWKQLHSEQTPAVIVQRMTPDDVRSYFVSQFGVAEGGRLFGSMNESLRDLARNPLILWLIKKYTLTERQLMSKSRAELLGSFVEVILRREASKGINHTATPVEVKIACLSNLAYTMQEHHTLVASGSIIRNSISASLETHKENFDWRDVLGECKSNGLIVGETEIRYVHQMFQDYFAALETNEKVGLLNLTGLALDGWWHETVIMLCGFAPNASNIIATISETNLLLALKCLAETTSASQEIKQNIFDALVEQFPSLNYERRLEIVRIVRRITGRVALDFLFGVLSDPHPSVRASAGYGLSWRGDTESIQFLLEKLPYASPPVQQQILFLLKRAPSHATSFAVEPLIPYLSDEGKTGTVVALIIGRIGKSAAGQLHQIVAEGKLPNIINAVKALSRFNSAEAIPGLILALKYPPTRHEAAIALGRLKEKQAIDPLIEIIRSGNENYQNTAIEVLAQLDRQSAVGPLIDALGNIHSGVRRMAARNLGQLNDKRAIAPLLDLFGDQDENVRRVAIKALIRLDEQQAYDHLVGMLKDKSGSVRREAVKGLGQLGNKQALPHLMAMLTDRNPKVRTATSKAIRKLEQTSDQSR